MLNPFVGKEVIHTQSLLCQSAIVEAALCISSRNESAAIEHLQQASFAIERVLKVLDELRERPPREGN